MAKKLRFRLDLDDEVVLVWIDNDPRWHEFRGERFTILHDSLPGDIISHLRSDMDVTVHSNDIKRFFRCVGAVVMVEAGGNPARSVC